MTQHIYDEVIDMTNSSVFHAGYWDDEDKVVYLVFNNGTTVSRKVHSLATTDDIGRVRSWGTWWNYSLRNAESGPEVNSGDEFIHRSQVVEQATDNKPLDGDVWDVFKSALNRLVSEYREEWFINDYENELRAALTAAIDSLPTAQTEPADAEAEESGTFADAARDSEGTFIGLGFFDVPEDVRSTVLSAVNHFTDFIRTEVGDISNVVEQFDAGKVRDLFKRFM